MSLTLYRSTDAGAPQLTGQNGSLIAVLDAVLRTGYGSKAGAGWARPHTGTDTAVFRLGSGSTGFYMQVIDSGAGAGGSREARVRGYEAMADATAGTNPFPTTAQNSSLPIIITKSATTDGTYRGWLAVASETYLYLFIETGSSAGNYAAFFFGDLVSYKSGGDDYRCAIIGRYQESYSSSGAETFHLLTNSLSTVHNGHFVARAYNGLGSSTAVGVIPADSKSSTAAMGTGALPAGPGYNGPNGGVYLSAAEVVESGHVRGKLPGLRVPCHNRPFAHADSVSAGGTAYIAVNLWGGTGQVLLEVPA